jgi:anti-sigma B factor antagonist
LMIRANRVARDRAAPDRGINGDMGAVIDLAQALQLELACQVTPDGKAIVRVRGELDIATADQAYTYLRDVVDHQDGPVLMNLSELTFCDAAGLGVLARVAGHARRSGRSLRLTSARPALLRIMRITGLDEAFPEVRDNPLSVIALPRQASPAGSAEPGSSGRPLTAGR